MTTPFDAAQAFADIALELAASENVSDTRQNVVRLATSTLGLSGATIWHLSDAITMTLDASTDPSFATLMQDIIGQGPDGPAWAALQDQQVHVSPDLSVETRWPYYTERLLADSPVRSIMGSPLTVGKHQLGVLALYSGRRGHFTDGIQALAPVFAAHAALALESAFVAEKNEHLEIALTSNRRIGMAVGILMALHRITDRQSFDLLRITSQNRQQKLRDLAEEVVLTGTLPPWKT